MERKRLLHTIGWAVALAALAYLVWRLATYDDYASLGESLRAMGWRQWTALALCVALMPANMAIEAWRWQALLPMPFRDAQRQVYYSRLAGLITPWRLGDYPARALLMDEKQYPLSQVLSMGAVGSATMTAAIIIAGVVALVFSPQVLSVLGNNYLYALSALILLLGALFLLMPKILRRWAELNQSLLWRSVAQSLVRLACWCVQLWLVLWALDAIPASPFTNLPIYYLLVTVTPSVPVAEAGVRGAWAIWLFGSVNAALAGVLLWAINTLLPCLIGVFMQKKECPGSGNLHMSK